MKPQLKLAYRLSLGGQTDSQVKATSLDSALSQNVTIRQAYPVFNWLLGCYNNMNNEGITQFSLSWVGCPNGGNLCRPMCKFDLGQSERSSSQVNARSGRTESPIRPASFQLAASCESVWSEPVNLGP